MIGVCGVWGFLNCFGKSWNTLARHPNAASMEILSQLGLMLEYSRVDSCVVMSSAFRSIDMTESKTPFPRGRVVADVAENPLDAADVDGGVVEKVEDEDTRQTLIVEDGLGGDFGGAVNVADVERVALGVLVVIPAGAPSAPAVPVGVDGVMTRADPEATTAPAAGGEIPGVWSGPAASPGATSSSKGCEKSKFIVPKKVRKKMRIFFQKKKFFEKNKFFF